MLGSLLSRQAQRPATASAWLRPPGPTRCLLPKENTGPHLRFTGWLVFLGLQGLPGRGMFRTTCEDTPGKTGQIAHSPHKIQQRLTPGSFEPGLWRLLFWCGAQVCVFLGTQYAEPTPACPPSECDPQCLQQVPDLLRYHTSVLRVHPALHEPTQHHPLLGPGSPRRGPNCCPQSCR